MELGKNNLIEQVMFSCILNKFFDQADYTPRLSDIQTFINYDLNTNWQISFCQKTNEYSMVPEK